MGDLEDDHTVPAEKPLIERIDSNTWTIQGTAPLDDVALMLGVNLPYDDYDTFGGMVFGLLGSVPSDDSTPELEEYGLQIRITKIKERRLESAVVYVTDPQEKDKADD